MLSVFAQSPSTTGRTDKVASFANRLFEQIIDPITALLAFVAIILLIYAVFRFMRSSSGDRDPSFKGLAMAVFGIFIIFSIWTIFSFVSRLATSEKDADRRTYQEEHIDFLIP